MKNHPLRLVLTMVMSISAAASSAQEREVISLWDTVPGESGPKEAHVLSDDRRRGVTRIARVSNPVLHVYPAAPGKNQGKGIIVCPGGGYQILAIDLEGHEIAAWLSNLGYTAFVLEYRVPKKPVQALQDLQRAIRLVKSRSAEWGIRNNQVGAIGFSAGGDLVARAGSDFDKQLYTPQDAADSLSAKPAFSLLIYPAYLDKGDNRSITPDLKIHASYPPTFLFATADDAHGNSTLVMAGALRDAKIPVEQHLYPTGGHGYGLRPGNRAAESWPLLAEKWLQLTF